MTCLPADFGGAHYYEYKIDNLEAGKKLLAKALKKWSANNCVAALKALGK
jgi:hypothetical protein